MKITLIAVPYHLGRENVGMGAGPVRFKEAGADRFLRDLGHQAEFRDVRIHGKHSDELEAIGEIDAHGDSNTPETSPSGFFDGMALAVATGACYVEVARRVGLERGVPEAHVVLAAVRDLDPLEKERLQRSEIAVVTYEPESTLSKIEHALDSLRKSVESVYLHIDLDVLNPDEARANEYNPSGGLSRRELGEAIESVARRFVVSAASVTAYNPAYDPDGRVLEAGLEVMEQLAEIARKQSE